MKKYVRFLYNPESGSGSNTLDWALTLIRKQKPAQAPQSLTDDKPGMLISEKSRTTVEDGVRRFDPNHPPKNQDSPEYRSWEQRKNLIDTIVDNYILIDRMVPVSAEQKETFQRSFRLLQKYLSDAQALWLQYDDLYAISPFSEIQKQVTKSDIDVLREKMRKINPEYKDYDRWEGVDMFTKAWKKPYEKDLAITRKLSINELQQQWLGYKLRETSPALGLVQNHDPLLLIYRNLSQSTRQLIINRASSSIDPDDLDYPQKLAHNIYAIAKAYINKNSISSWKNDRPVHFNVPNMFINNERHLIFPEINGQDKISDAITQDVEFINDLEDQVSKSSAEYVSSKFSLLDYEEKMDIYREAEKRAGILPSDKPDNSFGASRRPSPELVIQQVVNVMGEKIIESIESDFKRDPERTKEADLFARLTPEEKQNLLKRALEDVRQERDRVLAQTGHGLRDEKGNHIDSDGNPNVIRHITNIMRSEQAKQSTSNKLSWLRKLLSEWVK